MKPSKEYKIAIIGAGIAGLTAAIMLEQQGYQTAIFEASPAVRGIGAGLGLASNGIKAFNYLGLDKEVMAISNPLTGFTINDAQRKSIFSIDTDRIKRHFKADNYAVDRGNLHQLLSKKIVPSKIHPLKKLTHLESKSDHVIVRFSDKTEEWFHFVIGADGVHSQVRQNLIPESIPRYTGYWCWRGIVNHSLKNPHQTEAVWAKKGRFGYTPLSKNKVYWFSCINAPKKSNIPQYELPELKENFKNYYPLVSHLLDKSHNDQLIRGPILDIDPITQYHFNRVLLIGDAAHAATPNMGQGACLAIEDVAVLQDELQQGHTLQKASKNFESRRLNRTHYIMKNSRKAGKIAQIENGFINTFRNSLFRILPDSITQFPLKRLLEEDFMQV